jgi:Fe/S biogenesis protein NfuA
VSTLETFDVLSIAENARTVVREALEQEANADALALYVEVVGTRGAGYAYDLYFSELSAAPAGAAVGHDGDVAIVVPAASVARLRGSRLEFSEEGGGGLVLVNPNSPTAEELHAGVDPAILALGVDGPLGQRASAVLEASVNPSIASHGGRADLVALDETQRVAYIKMSGGCQGCAMSRLTLTQGIESALKDALPELTDVVDVTDHASGVNPFYSPEA